MFADNVHIKIKAGKGGDGNTGNDVASQMRPKFRGSAARTSVTATLVVLFYEEIRWNEGDRSAGSIRVRSGHEES